jgi:hypothetical protein
MAEKKPNIVIIWGDDIGQSNVSAYSDGLMGYRTPNIDRIANEGIRFTTLTPNRAAQLGDHRSSPANAGSVPGTLRSACRAPRKVCKPAT